LELNFYFANLPEVEAFTRLVTTLLALGAKFTGTGYAHRGEGLRDKPFASTHDSVLEPVPIRDVTDLTRSLADPDIRLVQVYMEGATSTMSNVAEIVTYLSISPEAAHTDRHPLAIWTDGEVFSGPLREKYTQRARKVGRRTYERFRALIEALRPAYAAITSEWSLECPADLRRDPRSLAFRNFFVSRAHLEEANLAYIQRLYSRAYIEPMGDGLYISCSKEFNPLGRGLDVGDTPRQTEVGKLIGFLD
jgi:hypothetical protein